MERTRCDEQYVVRLDRSVFRVDRAALDERQKVSLYALAGHVGTIGVLSTTDLVDFINEYDPVLLCVANRLGT